MPKIQFANLPRPVWQHLLQRVEERRISLTDLIALQEWVKTGPIGPVGDWYKDFGSFVLCGTDQFPKTVLEKGMKPFGSPIDGPASSGRHSVRRPKGALLGVRDNCVRMAGTNLGCADTA